MLRARRRTPLWVSREGIGYPPETAEDPGFLRWAQVAAVSHDVHDVRGLVYSHGWTIRPGEPAATGSAPDDSGPGPGGGVEPVTGSAVVPSVRLELTLYGF